jgi:hypothetical protein
VTRLSQHHLAPLTQKRREIVSGTNSISLGMGELALDRLMIPAYFV